MPDYILEYLENHSDNHAEDRCELCGALRYGQGDVDRDDSDAPEALRWIANLYNENRIAAHIILQRLIKPKSTYAELAKSFPCTSDGVCKRTKWLAKRMPSLARFLGLEKPEAISQRRRRQSERIQPE